MKNPKMAPMLTPPPSSRRQGLILVLLLTAIAGLVLPEIQLMPSQTAAITSTT